MKNLHKVGARVTVSMGVDAGKSATIIPMSRVKLNSRGVPDIGQGHYKPVSKDDRAVQYDNGVIDVQGKWNLIASQQNG